MKFRKKPVIIEAIQWDGTNLVEVKHFMKIANLNKCGESLHIHTLEGTMEASKNDYIIKGIKGEFYPCKPDIFISSYEEVVDCE